jgi:hypothetical protein
MLSYFSEQLAGNASRGLINRVTDVKLLQGDLAEAWREGDTDYATVATKFALKDSMVESASGRTVEGGERSEVTELWTFVCARAGNWLLSAIHQTKIPSAVPANGIRRVAAALRQSDLARRRISNRATTSRWRPSQPHPAVNRLVAGSNPARGAKLKQRLSRKSAHASISKIDSVAASVAASDKTHPFYASPMARTPKQL